MTEISDELNSRLTALLQAAGQFGLAATRKFVHERPDECGALEELVASSECAVTAIVQIAPRQSVRLVVTVRGVPMTLIDVAAAPVQPSGLKVN